MRRNESSKLTVISGIIYVNTFSNDNAFYFVHFSTKQSRRTHLLYFPSSQDFLTLFTVKTVCYVSALLSFSTLYRLCIDLINTRIKLLMYCTFETFVAGILFDLTLPTTCTFSARPALRRYIQLFKDQTYQFEYTCSFESYGQEWSTKLDRADISH